MKPLGTSRSILLTQYPDTTRPIETPFAPICLAKIGVIGIVRLVLNIISRAIIHRKKYVAEKPLFNIFQLERTQQILKLMALYARKYAKFTFIQ